MDILVPQRHSARQVNQANTKRTEFKPNRYTSGSANLDDMIALGKAVILCDAHSRKFSPKKARYSPHPDPKLRRVLGRCDVCQQEGLSFLYINGNDAESERKKVEKFLRSLEYGKIFNG